MPNKTLIFASLICLFGLFPHCIFGGFTLFRFRQMIQEITGRRALDYNNYGNFCGFGGSGEPVDEIDRCCKVHDECYERASSEECSRYKIPIYTIGYRIETLGNGKVLCDPYDSDCSKTLCNCDKTCAQCFAENDKYYNRTNRRFLG